KVGFAKAQRGGRSAQLLADAQCVQPANFERERAFARRASKRFGSSLKTTPAPPAPPAEVVPNRQPASSATNPPSGAVPWPVQKPWRQKMPRTVAIPSGANLRTLPPPLPPVEVVAYRLPEESANNLATGQRPSVQFCSEQKL